MSTEKQKHVAAWAREEFGQADLGDSRRTERLVHIATARGERPAASLPEGVEDPSALKGLYRFMANERVEREAVLTSDYRATAERCAREAVVLAVQDTTEVDYSHHPATEGLGLLGDERHRGFLLHSTLAITPNRVPLGLLDQQVIYRRAEEYGKRHRRKQRPIAEKEIRKWLDSLDRTRAVSAAYLELLLVSVGAREADVYDLFWRAEPWPHPMLIRACWNRGVIHEERYLWDFIEHPSVAGDYRVTVPRQGARREREATVTVRYGRVSLKPPVHRAREHLPALPVDVILAREEDPPAGVEPLTWLLITTVAVTDLESALERIQWYTCRWGIEVYHKVLKSGCRIEDRQFDNARTLERYLAVDAVVAWRCWG
ncbi:IS4 family transposase [Methylocaldum sp. MU1018]